MQTLLQDLRYGARMLRKQPGFALAAALTLALGIGGSTAIFSIIQTVLLRPLGFPAAERVLALWERTPEGKQPRSRAAPGNFYDWREQNQSFAEMAAFATAAMTLTGAGEPEQLRGAMVTPSYFKALDVRPALGRAFLPEESRPGKERVVLLGQGVWQRRFGADPNLLGQSVTLDDNSYTVIGVMGPGLFPVWPATTGKFSFDQSQQQFWVPLAETAEQHANRRSHVWGVIGRLKDGVTLRQAQTEMDAIGARLAEQYPQFNRGEGIILRPFADELVGDVRPALLILFGAVGMVLLIACANVAGLLLARYALRQKEVAIRAALGAGRARLLRQFLTEGLLLSLVGGASGVWLAAAGMDWLLKLIPVEIPRLAETSLDWRVLCFTLCLSLLTSLLFGLAPALQAARGDLREALQDGGRGSIGAGPQRLRRALVSAQIALAVMLLVGAGLLIRSYERLQQVNPGFNPERLLAAELNLPPTQYTQWRQVSGFYDQLLERVRQLPGVESAAFAYDHPLEANWIDSFSIEGRPVPATGERLIAWLRIVSAGYFRTAGVALLRGREFSAQDDPQHPGAVIINEAFAAQYFPHEDPLGKRLRVTTPSGFWGAQIPASFEIVGVAGNVKFLGLNADSAPAYYLPDKQFPQESMCLLARTSGDPLAGAAALRQAVLSVDRAQPIAAIRTMESLMTAQTARARFNTVLMGLFGAVALALAMLGVFGLLSYQVAQQAREFGLRMALGAQPGDVLRLVIRQGLKPVIAGAGCGLLGAYALTRLMTALLFGVGATDLPTFVGVALLLTGVALLACWIPARRAAKVDPMIALRRE